VSDVRIADLKARLSEHLRSVRNGDTLTVLDRGTPVGANSTLHHATLEIRRATRRLRDLKLPARPSKRTDSVGIL
jgi:antitoxin (DNA-binding transcriptional repressor) of toxin-antitoxin stability system